MINVDLDKAPCYYFSFDENTELVHVNELLCSALGYQPSEIIGKKINHILTIASKIFFQTHWSPLLKLQGTVNELYVALLSKDGVSVPVLFNSNRKLTEGGSVTSCVGIRISNRVEYEAEILKAQRAYELALVNNAALTNSEAQLQQHAAELNKIIHRLKLQNDELKQINKVVTHDLQEPVRKLLFYSNALKPSSSDAAEITFKNLDRIQLVANRLRRIVSGLQQYMWLTELDSPFTVIDLNLIIREVITELKSRYPDVNIVVQADPLPSISGNNEQHKAMLMHLLDNAIRFRKPGEDARITIGCILLEQNSLQQLPNRYHYTKYVRVTIADNGIGIDPGLKDEIFKLFFTTEPSGGLGLGLALSKKVIEYHQGTISATSEPGKGTIITFTLPLHPLNLANDDSIHR